MFVLYSVRGSELAPGPALSEQVAARSCVHVVARWRALVQPSAHQWSCVGSALWLGSRVESLLGMSPALTRWASLSLVTGLARFRLTLARVSSTLTRLRLRLVASLRVGSPTAPFLSAGLGHGPKTITLTGVSTRVPHVLICARWRGIREGRIDR